MGKSSKEKVSEKFAKLNEYDKASNRYGMSINIERKEINGVPQLTFSCDMWGGPTVDMSSKSVPKQPLRKEFTDKESFVRYVEGIIDDVEKQI